MSWIIHIRRYIRQIAVSHENGFSPISLTSLYAKLSVLMGTLQIKKKWHASRTQDIIYVLRILSKMHHIYISFTYNVSYVTFLAFWPMVGCSIKFELVLHQVSVHLTAVQCHWRKKTVLNWLPWCLITIIQSMPSNSQYFYAASL